MPDQTNNDSKGLLIFKSTLTTFIVLTFISTIFGYDECLKLVSKNQSSNQSENDHIYWDDWRVVIIIYYISIEIVTFIGFFGVVFYNYRLSIIYSNLMLLFFMFGFVNEALRKNVFGLVVELPTALLSLIFSLKIKYDETHGKSSKVPKIWTVQERNNDRSYTI